MRTEWWILLIAGALLYNAYHDCRYSKLLVAYKKYYQMAGIALVALCLFVTLRRSPNQGRQMLYYASQMVQQLPVDRHSVNTLSRVFDLTTQAPVPFMQGLNRFTGGGGVGTDGGVHGGPRQCKRAVSETKKKYVASQQDWKCGQCRRKLSHTFEVDHHVRLDQGGTNDVSNLIALCRECHGEKTAMENM